MLTVTGIVCIVVLVLAWFGIKSDQRWHQRHPGANERCAEVDEELTSQGK